MSDVTRREALQRLAATFVAAGIVDPLAAQDLHHAVQQTTAASSGSYKPKALSLHEFRTLERLTELIIPVDNGKPGALQADVPAWIDMLLAVNDELKTRYTSGLAWIDATMKSRGVADFVSAAPEQQAAVLDVIAFRKNRSSELEPGIDFFVLLRRMTVDGFYTSRIGMRDIYPGNTPQATFTVPPEAIDHVLRRSSV